jgi:protease-4
MGNVAASGGYYISMAADSIVAEPNTLTGSIGVFATIPNAEELFNDKLGITFDEVKTHEHADWFSMTRNLTPSEMKAAEQFTNEVYEVFVQKAADNRDMSFDEVDEVAQGRVWTGTAAKEQGLVDELGGLDRALAIAAEKAQLEAYNVDQYPKPKTFYELIMGSGASQVKSLMSDHWFTNPIKEEVSDNLSMLKQRGALLLLPYDITIE